MCLIRLFIIPTLIASVANVQHHIAAAVGDDVTGDSSEETETGLLRKHNVHRALDELEDALHSDTVAVEVGSNGHLEVLPAHSFVRTRGRPASLSPDISKSQSTTKDDSSGEAEPMQLFSITDHNNGTSNVSSLAPLIERARGAEYSALLLDSRFWHLFAMSLGATVAFGVLAMFCITQQTSRRSPAYGPQRAHGQPWLQGQQHGEAGDGQTTGSRIDSPQGESEAVRSTSFSSEDGPLAKAFWDALSWEEHADAAREFVEENWTNVAKVLNICSADGRLTDRLIPASCYNDFYKWTMLPVIVAVEKAYESDIRCTFSVNIRDESFRNELLMSATGQTSPALYTELKGALAALAMRPFDRLCFERCVKDSNLPGWEAPVLDAVCGRLSEPRMLIQEFRIDEGPSEPSRPGDVLVEVYVAHDEKLKQKRVYIEATGPWHRVTWLETSMMQCVYDVLFRHQKRKDYREEDELWYPKWLAAAFCRCAWSTEAAEEAGLAGALFTGRRTGGLPLMMLQGLYMQSVLKGKMLGSSSVTARYFSLDAGVPAEMVPKAVGTHAHELSMTIGAILGEVDDKAGMPLSQIIGHMLYFYKSRPQGDVKDLVRKPMMAFLPDTLGSRAFMTTAGMLTVPHGAHEGEAVLSVFGCARQDSGKLEAFKALMDEFGFKGPIMASEIETSNDLMIARDNGFALFGSGGFMGDSEKAWGQAEKNISMAVKVNRVYVKGTQVQAQYSPVKTGETGSKGKIKDGKFEVDGKLSADDVQAVKNRAQTLAKADPKIDSKALQKLFAKTLDTFFTIERK
jgi:hypothetical protein